MRSCRGAGSTVQLTHHVMVSPSLNVRVAHTRVVVSGAISVAQPEIQPRNAYSTPCSDLQLLDDRVKETEADLKSVIAHHLMWREEVCELALVRGVARWSGVGAVCVQEEPASTRPAATGLVLPQPYVRWFVHAAPGCCVMLFVLSWCAANRVRGLCAQGRAQCCCCGCGLWGRAGLTPTMRHMLCLHAGGGWAQPSPFGHALPPRPHRSRWFVDCHTQAAHTHTPHTMADGGVIELTTVLEYSGEDRLEDVTQVGGQGWVVVLVLVAVVVVCGWLCKRVE